MEGRPTRRRTLFAVPTIKTVQSLVYRVTCPECKGTLMLEEKLDVRELALENVVPLDKCMNPQCRSTPGTYDIVAQKTRGMGRQNPRVEAVIGQFIANIRREAIAEGNPDGLQVIGSGNEDAG